MGMRWIRNAGVDDVCGQPWTHSRPGRRFAVWASIFLLVVCPMWLGVICLSRPDFQIAEQLRHAADARIAARQSLPASLDELAASLNLHPNRWTILHGWSFYYSRQADDRYHLSIHRFGGPSYYYGDGAWAYDGN